MFIEIKMQEEIYDPGRGRIINPKCVFCKGLPKSPPLIF